MKIKRYNQLSIESDMLDYFIDNLEVKLVESSETKEDIESIKDKIIKDLKLNATIIATYGAGITSMYTIVFNLVKNSNLSIDASPENIVLLTIAALSVIYLEEQKGKIEVKKEENVRKDCKTMLEELKLNGIGNGIVKKMVECFKSVKNIYNVIMKHAGKAAIYLIDMFLYTSLLIPFLNGISFVVGKYDLNMETLPGNFLGLAVGVGGVITKHGISYILDKMKGKVKVDKKAVLGNIEVKKMSQLIDTETETKGELIKEQ